MNIQDTIVLLEALKASGVTRFKSHEHEIDLSPSLVSKVKQVEHPADADPKAVADATEKLKSLINTVKMSPEELANQIFPDGAL